MADPTGEADFDERAGEAMEHLRAAAKEMICAARGFLDLAEDLVDDPKAGDAVVETLSGLADAARRGVSEAVADARDGSDGDTFERIDLD